MSGGEGSAARSSWLVEIRMLLRLLPERCSWPSVAGTGGAAQLLAAEVGLCECAKRMGKGLPFCTGVSHCCPINASV